MSKHRRARETRREHQQRNRIAEVTQAIQTVLEPRTGFERRDGFSTTETVWQGHRPEMQIGFRS